MENLSKLSDSLNELILLHGLTEKSLAENCHLPVSCVSLYVRGKQAPYLDSLIKLADYFHCSVDYLLGRTDTYTQKEYLPCPPFSDRIDELLKASNLPLSDIYNKKTGISKSSFYTWKRGESAPTLDNIVKLAEIFGCSVDFLLGREN